MKNNLKNANSVILSAIILLGSGMFSGKADAKKHLSILLQNRLSYSYQNNSKILRIQGVVTKVEVGNDSVGIWIINGGKSYLFSLGASTDGFPEQYQNGPSRLPSITDIGSKVDITYQGQFLLDYHIISRPSHLWIIISGSSSDKNTDYPPDHFQDLKYALYQKGCMTEILNSSNFQALRPGYWIVASGGFTNTAQAENCRKKSISLGVKDAYIRKIW